MRAEKYTDYKVHFKGTVTVTVKGCYSEENEKKAIKEAFFQMNGDKNYVDDIEYNEYGEIDDEGEQL
ncbi:MAG: hypothetical protein FWB73_00200 [Treponema sp.]|nr:hypothetical protein [Treponema sp.]